jgi:hypothetical protein
MAVTARNFTALTILVAVAALLVGVMAGPASADPVANTAKKAKKCKKGKKGTSAKKNKKKCKKVKKQAQAQSPVVRATITWTEAGSDDADLTLYAFDAAGNVAKSGTPSGIPNSTTSADQKGPAGTETWTDLAPNPRRAISFGVCYQVGGSVHAPFTITYVTADGQTRTDTQDPGSSFSYEYLDGPAIPTSYCPD